MYNLIVVYTLSLYFRKKTSSWDKIIFCVTIMLQLNTDYSLFHKCKLNKKIRENKLLIVFVKNITLQIHRTIILLNNIHIVFL